MSVTKTIYWMRKRTVDWRRLQNRTADIMFGLSVAMAVALVIVFFRIGHSGYTAFGLPRFDAFDWMMSTVFFIAIVLTVYEAYFYKKYRSEYQTARKALVDRLTASPCTCTTYCTCAEDFIEETYRLYKINLYYF